MFISKVTRNDLQRWKIWETRFLMIWKKLLYVIRNHHISMNPGLEPILLDLGKLFFAPRRRKLEGVKWNKLKSKKKEKQPWLKLLKHWSFSTILLGDAFSISSFKTWRHANGDSLSSRRMVSTQQSRCVAACAAPRVHMCDLTQTDVVETLG